MGKGGEILGCEAELIPEHRANIPYHPLSECAVITEIGIWLVPISARRPLSGKPDIGGDLAARPSLTLKRHAPAAKSDRLFTACSLTHSTVGRPCQAGVKPSSDFRMVR